MTSSNGILKIQTTSIRIGRFCAVTESQHDTSLVSTASDPERRVTTAENTTPEAAGEASRGRGKSKQAPSLPPPTPCAGPDANSGMRSCNHRHEHHSTASRRRGNRPTGQEVAGCQSRHRDWLRTGCKKRMARPAGRHHGSLISNML